MRKNQNVREYAKKKGVRLWQIASQIGISEPTITRWMRVDLSSEKEKRILDAIDQISTEVS